MINFETMAEKASANTPTGFMSYDEGILQLFNNYSGLINIGAGQSEIQRILNNSPDLRCEWGAEDWGDDTYALYYAHKPTGIVTLSNHNEINNTMFTFNGVNYYLCYVDARCSWGAGPNGENIDFFLTNGRVLWCYILNAFYNIISRNTGGQGRFIVCNKSTTEAKGYHIKMGMQSFINAFGNHSNDPALRHHIRSHLGNLSGEENAAAEEYLNNGNVEGQSGYLFYVQQPVVNYTNLIDIFNSLPPKELTDAQMKSERNLSAGYGGRGKRKYKKRYRKRNKTKRKRSKTKRHKTK